MDRVLLLSGVNVARGDLVLRADVSFALSAGEVCHLVGQNGAGKSTLLMQIAGMLPTPKGTIDAKPLVYVGHAVGISELLTVEQNLRFLTALYDTKPSGEDLQAALAAVGLLGYQDLRGGELSAGQTRRAALAKLWLLDAKTAPLWLLDEPFTALDTAMTQRLFAKIQDFAKSGGAALFTSHQAAPIATSIVDLADFCEVDDA